MNPIYLESIVVALGIVLLMVEAFAARLDKRVLGYSAILGLLVVFGLTFIATPEAMNPEAAYAAYYTADGFAMFFKRFSLLATVVVLLLAVDYLPVVRRYVPGITPGAGTGEFFILPLFACAGLMWMVSAIDFIVLFVSLELVTITFYVLVAYMRRNKGCLEAGTKYLILGALSTGFLVFGIAWIFGATGQTHFTAIHEVLATMPDSVDMAVLFGLGMVLIALGFKVAAVPFQFWVPDVYQGAPTPMTAYLSVASKAAGFVVLLRVLEPFLAVPRLQEKILPVIAVIAGATMIFGNLAALPQTNFKRLLAYSSIAHAGYLLMGVAAIGTVTPAGQSIIGFYLFAYFLMTFLAFMVMLHVARVIGGDDIAHFNGLSRRSPALAGVMTVAVLSLAGIPLTAGFFGKFFLFEAAVRQGLVVLVVIGVIAVACGFYYYLKILRAMYWQPPREEDAAPVSMPPLTWAVAVVLMALIFVFGVYPRPILNLFF